MAHGVGGCTPGAELVEQLARRAHIRVIAALGVRRHTRRAWLKALGTGMVAVFCAFTYDNPFTITLGVVCALPDAAYILLLWRRM